MVCSLALIGDVRIMTNLVFGLSVFFQWVVIIMAWGMAIATVVLVLLLLVLLIFIVSKAIRKGFIDAYNGDQK